MIPVGDWTKEVYDEVHSQRQLRHCWVRGPFVSTYSIASNFSHLVLMASGIGITPALGVMGQYKEISRTKVLVWTTRCPTMLKFFAPLLVDASMSSIIYYSGEQKLSSVELKRMIRGRNVFIHQSRAENLARTVSTIITSIACCEMHKSEDDWQDSTRMEDNVPLKMCKHQWCIFYCGGSKAIFGVLSACSKEFDIQFHYEMYNW